MRAAVLFVLSILFSCLAVAQSPADTSVRRKTDSIPKISVDTTVKIPRVPRTHQLRIGFDIYRIAYNLMWPSRQGYEVQADYALNQKTYLVTEAGLGKGKIDYSNLQYDNSSYFFRLGVDQQFLDVISNRDFDIGFIGIRYGMAAGNRSPVTYEIPSPFGPSATGNIESQSYIVHWAEVTGGIKVECWKGLFVGWNIRGKFMFNSGIFKEIAPNYIAGYGKGDKSTNFDFNFYLSYAIRWKSK
ncbi:DUF6048 family protein [Taibaiella koreensis]|uniref:DUF6048 family protein n=1 Tax=Taibaiella koreensis TaxID=1268548 RepID=UPI0013C2C769|nr:DUF6048 family protein [Taibaiella koreensis]